MGKRISCGDGRLMDQEIWSYSFSFNQEYSNKILTDQEINESMIEMLDKYPTLKQFLYAEKDNEV